MKVRLLLTSALAVVIHVAVPMGGQSHVGFRDGTAESLFNASRNAIGGEGTVNGIQSLLMRGTATVTDDDRGVEQRQVEIRILLPDSILRIDTAPGYVKRSGVHGETLLTSIREGDELESPPASMRGALIKGERARLGRLLLGMAAAPIRPGWLTLRSARTAVTTTDPRTTMGTDNPAGAATTLTAERAGQRVLEGMAQDGFLIRIFFDGSSLPFRIQYEAGKGTQVITDFSDRRRVSGLLLPHRLVTLAGKRVVDDLVLREIIVNPEFKSGDFER